MNTFLIIATIIALIWGLAWLLYAIKCAVDCTKSKYTRDWLGTFLFGAFALILEIGVTLFVLLYALKFEL